MRILDRLLEAPAIEWMLEKFVHPRRKPLLLAAIAATAVVAMPYLPNATQEFQVLLDPDEPEKLIGHLRVESFYRILGMSILVAALFELGEFTVGLVYPLMQRRALMRFLGLPGLGGPLHLVYPEFSKDDTRSKPTGPLVAAEVPAKSPLFIESHAVVEDLKAIELIARLLRDNHITGYDTVGDTEARTSSRRSRLSVGMFSNSTTCSVLKDSPLAEKIQRYVSFDLWKHENSSNDIDQITIKWRKRNTNYSLLAAQNERVVDYSAAGESDYAIIAKASDDTHVTFVVAGLTKQSTLQIADWFRTDWRSIKNNANREDRTPVGGDDFIALFEMSTNEGPSGVTLLDCYKLDEEILS